MDDTVRIRCSRCKASFRDKARRVRPGYSRQCASCEVVIYFEEHSSDKNVQQAMRDAHVVRKAMLAEERETAATQSKRRFERRGATSPDPVE